MSLHTIDRDFITQTLVRLVQINSVNPMLVPGAPGEREIGAFLAKALSALGLQVDTLEPEPGRPTVIARLPGTGGGRSLMLNAHSDTVDTAGMDEPFSGAIRDGRLYGRGSYDMKGSLAAMLGALKSLAALPRLLGDLVIAVVSDEEYGSIGSTALLASGLRTDAAIITEPTSLDVCIAHKGYLWIEVAVHGQAAHGSKFQLGIDANMKMGSFLHALAALERDLRTRTPHPLVGPPSLHAALLRGGSGLSTYAAQSTVQIERRTIPGETAAQAIREIEQLVARLAAEDPDFRATVKPFFVREPFEVPRDAAIVQSVAQASARVQGKEPAIIGETAWMDSALLQSAGIDTVICGPTGAGAHAAVEWVDLESVYRLAEVLVEAATGYCA